MNYENLVLPHQGKYIVAGKVFETFDAAKKHVDLTLATKAAFDKANPHSSSYNKDYTNYNDVELFKQLNP